HRLHRALLLPDVDLLLEHVRGSRGPERRDDRPRDGRLRARPAVGRGLPVRQEPARPTRAVEPAGSTPASSVSVPVPVAVSGAPRGASGRPAGSVPSSAAWSAATVSRGTAGISATSAMRTPKS